MDIKNLVTFIHVAELRSFTKAGDKLGYSQSTVSFQIRQLENELGVPLFERINRTVTLTEHGIRLLRSAYKINEPQARIQGSDLGAGGNESGNEGAWACASGDCGFLEQ